MAPNLFSTAKVLETKATAGKKPAKFKTLIEGLEIYAAIDYAIKSLKTLQETTKVAVLEVVCEKFVTDGIARKAQPGSFDAEEGKATANIQLRKRSTNSGLNDAEQELALQYNVPTEVVSDRPECFIFSPEPVHADWLEKNANKLSAALAKLGAPVGLIVRQTATTKVVTTDDSIGFVFRTYSNKPEVITTLLPVVSVPAIKAQYDATPKAALAVVKELIG